MPSNIEGFYNEKTYDLDAYYEGISELDMKPKSLNTQSSERFYKIRDVVGNGFIFWRERIPKKIGKLNKSVRTADFICPACGNMKRMTISVVLHSGCKSCGCIKGEANA
jgi:hypothetical protein